MLKLKASIYPILSWIFLILVLLGCAKDDSSDGLPFGGLNFTPFRGSSSGDYQNKIDEFDRRNANGDFNNTGIVSGQTPFNGPTRAAEASIAANRPYRQDFVSLVDLLNQSFAAGIIKMTITRDSTAGTDTIINTLVMSEDFGLDQLTATVDLVDLESGESFTNAQPTYYCWMAHIDKDTREAVKTNDLALPGDPELNTSTDAYCPIQINSLNTSNNQANIELLVEDLPRFEGSRKTIRSLGRYGDFTPGATNILGFEIKREAQNNSGQKIDLITTAYFVIITIDLTPPTGLRDYRFLGSRNGHEYYLITTPVGFSEVKTQAAILTAAAGGFKGYGVSINDQAEQTYLESIIPSGRIWIGLDDIAQEGNHQWHSGESRSFRGGESFNNDGNEDCIHLNFSRIGDKNDTECYNSYPVLIEVETTRNGGVID